MTQTSPSSTVSAPRFGGLYRSLIVNVGLPLVVVQVLLHRGTPAVTALAIAAIFPFAEALFVLARSRRFDPLAVLSLAAIVAGVATSAISGNAVFALAKESIITGVFGTVFLGSLLARRPLIFQLGRQFTAGKDPVALAAWDARWEAPGFRRVIRLMTAVWGGGLLLEAAVRIVVALTVPVMTASWISSALQVVAIGGLILWTNAYIRALRRKFPKVAA